MASCYHCGVSLRSGEGFRRNVLTSQSTRFYSRGGGSYAQSYGLRTLCHQCAEQIDEKARSAAWRSPFGIVLGIISSIFALRNMKTIDGLMFFFLLAGGPGFIIYFLLKLFEKDKLKIDTTITNKSVNTECEFIDHKPSNFDSEFIHEPNKQVAIVFGDVHKKFLGHGVFLLKLHGSHEDEQGARSVIQKLYEEYPIHRKNEIKKWGQKIYNVSREKFIKEAKLSMEIHEREFQKCLNEEITTEQYFSQIQWILNVFEYRDGDNHIEYINRFRETIKEIDSSELLYQN